jgi:hypothetical protein
MTKFPCSVGKGVAIFGNQATKRKDLDFKSAYKSYEQSLKDHYISSSGMSCLSVPLVDSSCHELFNRLVLFTFYFSVEKMDRCTA